MCHVAVLPKYAPPQRMEQFYLSVAGHHGRASREQEFVPPFPRVGWFSSWSRRRLACVFRPVAASLTASSNTSDTKIGWEVLRTNLIVVVESVPTGTHKRRLEVMLHMFFQGQGPSCGISFRSPCALFSRRINQGAAASLIARHLVQW